MSTRLYVYQIYSVMGVIQLFYRLTVLQRFYIIWDVSWYVDNVTDVNRQL